MSAGRIYALIFGIVFILVGIAGYMPQFMQGNLLFGYFLVDEMHNNIHILTGIVAVLAALKGSTSRLFFQIFGIIYAIVAILGFLNHEVFGMPLNMADNWLHVAIAVISLILGFLFKRY